MLDPESGRLSFYDNKIQTAKETVSAADNLADVEARRSSIAQARELLDNLDLDDTVRGRIDRALQEVAEDASKAHWVIANANPEGTKVANLAKRISVRLAERGVRFADVAGEKINVRTVADSVEGARGAKKFLAKAGGCAPHRRHGRVGWRRGRAHGCGIGR